MNIILPLDNLRLVDFNKIFKKYIETDILNDLDEYKLIKADKVNIKNKDVKKIMYHHIIHGLCEYILSVKGKEHVVIIYNTDASLTNYLQDYVDRTDLLDFLNKFVSKLGKMLPIRILCEPIDFITLRKDIKSNNGECKDVINKAKCVSDNFDISKYTFAKLRYFTKKYELEYLSNNYFQKVKNKQLILQ